MICWYVFKNEKIFCYLFIYVLNLLEYNYIIKSRIILTTSMDKNYYFAILYVKIFIKTNIIYLKYLKIIYDEYDVNH